MAVAASDEERDGWVEGIRSARGSLMAALAAMNPNSTLTSSASTNHLRRTLQALPHLPEDDDKHPPRGRVEHFVPAIWIPDGKSEACMRCGRPFGWRRRRHHCRLCGRCVCGSCSGKVQLSTSSQPDKFVDPVDFLFRLSISPKVRRTETTRPPGHVNSATKPCFLSWTVPPPSLVRQSGRAVVP